MAISHWWYQYKSNKHLQQKKETWLRHCQTIDPEETIFVSIVVNYDQPWVATIQDMFQQAYCPQRLTIGVLYVDEPITTVTPWSDVTVWRSRFYDDMDRIPVAYRDRVRQCIVNHTEFRGQGWARRQIETQLYNGERYYLRTTSHSGWSLHWDQYLIDQLKICLEWSHRPIITGLVEQMDIMASSPGDYSHSMGTYTAVDRFDDKTGLLLMKYKTQVRIPDAPIAGLFYTDTFSFSTALCIQESVYEPQISQYIEYIGMDIYMSVKWWMSGYDFYHLPRNVMTHDWHTFHQMQQQKCVAHSSDHDMSLRLCYQIMGVYLDPQTYILTGFAHGTKRTLSQYQTFIGIDLAQMTFTSVHGVMGIIPQPQATDILCRYTTHKEFEHIKQKWKNQFMSNQSP
jgi:hypothetical protein